MFAHEKIVQQAEPDPPIVVKAGEIDTGMCRILRKHAVVGTDPDLTVRVGTDLHLPGAAAAIDLPGVPPVGVDIPECRGGAEPCLARRRIGDGASDLHAAVDPLGPIVVRLQRDFEFVARLGQAVAEPIMCFELDPRGGQEIECGGGNKGAARQQFARDHPRAGIEHRVPAVGHAFGQWEVAAESSTGHAHARMIEAVERAIGRTPAFLARAPVARLLKTVTGVVEVVRPQAVAQDAKIDRCDQGRQSIPPYKEIDDPIKNIQESLQQVLVELKTVVFTRHFLSRNVTIIEAAQFKSQLRNQLISRL